MRQKRLVKRGAALALSAALLAGQAPFTAGLLSAQAAGDVPVITVDAYTQRAEISPYTLGSNHRHAYGGFGMYDEANDQVYPDFLEKTKESNLGVVRYPGGFTIEGTVEGCDLAAAAEITVRLPGDLKEDGRLNIEDVMAACKILAQQNS